jgi:hypothetical protein
MTSWVKSTYVKLPEMVMSQQSGVFPYGAVSSERSITGVRLFTRATISFCFLGYEFSALVWENRCCFYISKFNFTMVS